MKKTFIMAFVLAAVIGLAFAGSAFAQDGNPPLDGEKMYITGWFTAGRESSSPRSTKVPLEYK